MDIDRPTHDGVGADPSSPAVPGRPADDFFVTPPALSLPKGGGAIRGIGETVTANPLTGSASLSVPVALSPGRGGFGPRLALGYDSGSGNGPFGLGWSLGVGEIVRRTDRGLPRYADALEPGEAEDTFVLAGVGDLVPVPPTAAEQVPVRVAQVDYDVRRYRPRVEGGFALIERWTAVGEPGTVFWRTMSRDNRTDWYGRDPAARVTDPADSRRVFRWLLTESHDDRGNVIAYTYVAEDNRGVELRGPAERSRPAAAHTTNRYLKSVRYGNQVAYRPSLTAADPWPLPADDPAQAWLFTAVLDYGDHRDADPGPRPDQPWPVRPDPFSVYRSRFEVRTHRLCRRILMFHSFPTDPAVGADRLVRATLLRYQPPGDLTDPGQPGYTVLSGVTHRSYRRRADGTVVERELPPVTFGYQAAVIDPTVRILPALTNAPIGIEGGDTTWTDLDGDGLPGILAEVAGAWTYKPNLGEGRFGPARTVPAPAGGTRGRRRRLVDVTGAGRLELVTLGGADAGRHTRESDGAWGPFEPFRSQPNLDWNGPDLHLIDVTGDGRADVLTATGDSVAWYRSLGAEGYAMVRTVAAADGAEPRRVLSDRGRAVFLADMSGDGLADLVQVDAQGVRYLPNLGYGRFGAEIVPANAPRLDQPDRFDPGRVRLSDVDGSGPTDLIYLADDGARLYLNRSGNAFSAALVLDLGADPATTVQVADLFGAGTACLVLSSTRPRDAGAPVRYVDLMAAGKPHLLVSVDNQLGGTVEIGYTPSTRFAVADRLAGSPWLDRLPFPVHCLSRVTRRDRWRGTAFTTTYSYHHGCYDGVEREFRGFGRVEQVDTEAYGVFSAGHAGNPAVSDPALFQPPVKTVTWYHPGASVPSARTREAYAAEAFPARWDLTGFQERSAPAVELPTDLSPDDRRDALRACGGSLLRQEVYELDPAGLAAQRHTPVRLFSVRTVHHAVGLVQPGAPGRPAVVRMTQPETVTYGHDLALPPPGAVVAPDPRVEQALVLRSDDLGNAQQVVTIGYPRRGTGAPAGLPAALATEPRIAAVQGVWRLAYVETRHTDDVVITAPAPAGRRGAVRHHRLRLPWETRAYSLTGVPVPAGGYHDRASLLRYGWCEDTRYPPIVGPGETAVAVTSLEFHQRPAGPGPHRRMVGRSRIRYFQDEDGIASPTAPHPFGRHGPRGLTYERYRLALTDALLNAVFREVDPVTGAVNDKLAWPLGDGGPTVREALTRPAIGGYVAGATVDPGLAGQYWARSGITRFGATASTGFYLPERYEGPFGTVTSIGYDPLRLYPAWATDPVGNTTTVVAFDHRVLAPTLIRDPNGNHHAVLHDTLGFVVATATQGKLGPGGWTGDRLDGLDPDPDPATVMTFCAGPTQDDAQARTWLGDATTRFVYDLGWSRDPQGRTLWGSRTPAACAIARERHTGDGPTSPIRVVTAYSDGSGGTVLTKVPATADPVTGADRWIVNGQVVVNNKGAKVMVYEPAFSLRFGPEPPSTAGVYSVTTYDAAGRAVRVDQPDGTFSRTEIGPWVSVAHDPNDTVRDSRWYVERGSPDPAQPLALTAPSDRRAAWLAARLAGTPVRQVLDPRGQPAITVVHHRGPDDTGTWVDAYRLTHTATDPDGGPLWTRDPRGNLVEQFVVPPKPDADPGDGLTAATVVASDLSGRTLFRHGMDDGDRWLLADAAGQPLATWDGNDRIRDDGTVVSERRLRWTRYDAARRVAQLWLRLGAGSTYLIATTDFADTPYLSAAELAQAQAANLIGQAVRVYDHSGLSTVDRVDLDGRVEQRSRTLVTDLTADVVDWAVDDPTALLARDSAGGLETHRELTRYDAFGRAVLVAAWHRPGAAGGPAEAPVTVSTFDRGGGLASRTLYLRARVELGPAGVPAIQPDPDPARTVPVVTAITRNARDQALTVALGNGTTTTYEYDPATFRVIRRSTVRTVAAPASPAVQDLRSTYDAAGNLVRLVDLAQDPAFHANTVVTAARDYVYDASYRLIEATGPEDAALTGAPSHPEGPWSVVPMPSPGTMRRYTQRFRYDAAGNLTRISHVAPGGGWTRNLEPVPDGNRILRSWDGTAAWDDTVPADRVAHRHDRQGNLLNLAATEPATDLRWGWHGYLRSLDLLGGGRAYYTYDGAGQRIAKRLFRLGGEVVERVYLGGVERYRRWVNDVLVEEVRTVHAGDDHGRALQVDDIVVAPTGSGRTLPRYQYGDHLGSVTVELDGAGALISREEFHPYGTTALRLHRSGAEVPAKRYRYTGMERDEESGLGYHSARYYAASLGRWTAVDPAGSGGGLNHYAYCAGAPTMARDPSGRAGFMDSERLAARFAGPWFSAPDPPPAPPPPDPLDNHPVIRAIKGAERAADWVSKNYDGPPRPASSEFQYPYGYYDTFIDREIGRAYADSQALLDEIWVGSVTEDWTDRTKAVPSLIFSYANFLASGAAYLAEHLVGSVLGVAGTLLAPIEKNLPGLLEMAPLMGPELTISARGGLTSLSLRARVGLSAERYATMRSGAQIGEQVPLTGIPELDAPGTGSPLFAPFIAGVEEMGFVVRPLTMEPHENAAFRLLTRSFAYNQERFTVMSLLHERFHLWQYRSFGLPNLAEGIAPRALLELQAIEFERGILSTLTGTGRTVNPSYLLHLDAMEQAYRIQAGLLR